MTGLVLAEQKLVLSQSFLTDTLYRPGLKQPPCPVCGKLLLFFWVVFGLFFLSLSQMLQCITQLLCSVSTSGFERCYCLWWLRKEGLIKSVHQQVKGFPFFIMGRITGNCLFNLSPPVSGLLARGVEVLYPGFQEEKGREDGGDFLR